MLEEFIEWEKKIKPEINLVLNIMSNPLSSEPAELISDLQQIEAWNARMGHLMAQADSYLDRYRLLAMPSKDGKSEADRKAVQDKEVSPIRLVRDTLEHLADSIKTRIVLGESVLAFHRAQYPERKPIQQQRIY